MRAAILYGPDDLRVEEVPDPEDDVLVRVEAATTCGTDVKMLRRGHPTLNSYPSPFGHEIAGVRVDTGERVLVGDSVPCGRCAPCLSGRTNICREMRWLLGGFAELIGAPAAALHPLPSGLESAGAAMAEPLAAAVHAVARGTDATDVGVLGGGPMGLMLARLLVLAGREVTLADPHPERREQAQAFGARARAQLGRHELVFEAVGRVETWRAAVEAAEPGGAVVLVGGCSPDGGVTFPTAPLHYGEVDVRGAFHHSPQEVDAALELLASESVDWRALTGPTIGLDDLADALRRPSDGPAIKFVVDPSR